MIVPQVMRYSLIEAFDAAWFCEDMPELSMTTTEIMEVDFRQHTIVLPEGKFDLEHFLRQAQGILSLYSYRESHQGDIVHTYQQ